jgi:hypothetical protein
MSTISTLTIMTSLVHQDTVQGIATPLEAYNARRKPPSNKCTIHSLALVVRTALRMIEAARRLIPAPDILEPHVLPKSLDTENKLQSLGLALKQIDVALKYAQRADTRLRADLDPEEEEEYEVEVKPTFTGQGGSGHR